MNIKNLDRKMVLFLLIPAFFAISFFGYGIVQKENSKKIVFQGLDDTEIASIAGEKKSNGEDKNNEILVHVIGCVNKPGVVRLSNGARLEDVLLKAGGPAQNAKLEAVNLAYKVEDGMQIFIPEKEAKPLNIGKQASKNNTKKPNPAVQAESLKSKFGISKTIIGVKESAGNDFAKQEGFVNINQADLKELDSLPGIGPSTAQKILDFKNQNGSFKTPSDIMKVKGIGKSKYEQIKDKIKV